MARRPGGPAEISARLAAAPGLGDAEAHRLAGLLDGESHLAITPNNGDGWRCWCAVALRDDDQDIMVTVRDKLGLGHLRPVAARNGSRPQVAWKVATKLECLALTEVLDSHPLRGRKRAEYEIWREAVMLWSSKRQGFGPGVRKRMTQLAAHLRTQRVYVEPPVDAPSPDLTDPYAAHYLAGFFSGEGSFALAPRNARIVIKLRRDDRPLLEAFRRDFGIGSVRDVATPEPWSPAAVWYAIGARDVLTAIGLFESAPLLGRKARQYEAWRPGAEAIAKAIIDKSPVDEAVVKEAREALAHATAYRPPPAQLHVDDGSSAACAAYLQVLRQWAASVDGPLSCGTYSAVRRREHPDWPKRETIAETFGSWHDALRSAGLEARAVRPRPSRLPRVEFTRLNGRADAAYRAAVVRRLRGLLRPT